MLAVEDQLDALGWATHIGGLNTLITRSTNNLAAVAEWVEKSPWIDFLATDESTRSSTSICLQIIDSWFKEKSPEDQSAVIKQLVQSLNDEGVAYDIGAHRDAPAGLRIWGGATVEAADTKKLLPWLDWAYTNVKLG